MADRGAAGSATDAKQAAKSDDDDDALSDLAEPLNDISSPTVGSIQTGGPTDFQLPESSQDAPDQAPESSTTAPDMYEKLKASRFAGMLRTSSRAAAANIKQATAKATEALSTTAKSSGTSPKAPPPDSTPLSSEGDPAAPSTFSRMKQDTVHAFQHAGQKASQGGTWLYSTTKTMTRQMRQMNAPLAQWCRSETSSRPCPRVMLACCTALVSGALQTEGLLSKPADEKLVDSLADHFKQAHGVHLVPAGTSGHVVGGLVKRFLLDMPEPLLTVKLAPDWTCPDTPLAEARALLASLPRANHSTALLILETCSIIASHSAINEMDAKALAKVLGPVVLWKADGTGSARVPLDADETGCLESVLEHLISNFKSVEEWPA